MTRRRRYPKVQDTSSVGSYPHKTHVGGGFRFDRVLEYRLVVKMCNSDFKVTNYCLAFPSHAAANEMFENLSASLGAHLLHSHFIALVQQDWWYKESNTGLYIGPSNKRYSIQTSRRITQWPLSALFTQRNFSRARKRQWQPPQQVSPVPAQGTSSTTNTDNLDQHSNDTNHNNNEFACKRCRTLASYGTGIV